MKKSLIRNVQFKKGPSKLLEDINASIDIDSRLYQEDIEASVIHTKMLIKTNIISSKDGNKIISGLKKILKKIERGEIKYEKKHEDIHMNIEAFLHKEIGNVAGKLHTARSRNDQVVTDFKMWIKKNSNIVDKEIKILQKSLLDISKKNIETVMPGYTHQQIAQPISLAHHLLAYVEMLGRDRDRLKDCIKRLNENPLGSGALSGTSFPIDRNFTTKLLKFSKPTRNSIDAVSDRDFVVEFIFVLSLVSVHLSRFAEEIILWSNQHYNFIILPDELSTGSSIMPQKKNPDGAELVRANVANLIGNLNSIIIILKGLPLTYSKDLQNDKKLTFDSFDNILLNLKIVNELTKKIIFNKKKMKQSIDQSFSTATDLADWLVKDLNYNFREAYKITGNIVAYAQSKNLLLSNMPLKSLQKFDKRINKNIYNILSPLKSMKSKTSLGGTSPKSVTRSIKHAIKKYLS